MHVVRDYDGLQNLQHTFESLKPSFIALDTEFVRQKTFYPELSLVQIAFKDECYVIDTLSAFWHKSLLNPILFDDFLTIVLHSCRQDLEILFYLYKILPPFIFDTQIAAVFLGLGQTISYHDLVKHYLNLNLDKSQQHTNWLKRPLSYDQVQYAARDVMYLADLYPMMIADLEKQNRLTWAMEEMKSLSNPSVFSVTSNARLSRLKISKQRYPFARLLFEFRERHASLLNINRSQFLSDSVIATLTIFKDTDKLIAFLRRTTKLEQYDLIEPLIEIFLTSQNLHLSDSAESLVPLSRSLKPFEQKKLKTLTDHRNAIAELLQMAPSFLATSEDMKDYILTSKGRLVSTWRAEALGLQEKFNQG